MGLKRAKTYITGRGHLYKYLHMHKEMSTIFHIRASSSSMMQKNCMFKGGYKQIHVVARQVKEYQPLCIFLGEVKLVRHARKFPVLIQIPKSPDSLILTAMVNGICCLKV